MFADARLIALAPELAEALRAVVTQGHRYAEGDVRRGVYESARALLAKLDGAA